MPNLMLDFHIWNDQGEVRGPVSYEEAVEYLAARPDEEDLYAENSDGDSFVVQDDGEVDWE